jgi:hypothetical protein
MLAVSPDSLAPETTPLPDICDDVDRGEHLRDRFELLSPTDLGLLIGVDERTLAVWRCQGRGPDYARLGRSIFYRRADVQTWIDLNITQTDRGVS